MSRSRFFLAATLSLNVVLGIVWYQAHTRAGARVEIEAKRRADREATEREAAERRELQAAIPAPLDAAVARELNTLSDDDFVARLKREGFPQAMMRALAQARIYDRYYAKRRALRNEQKVPYWSSGYGHRFEFNPNDRELLAKERALEVELLAQFDHLDELGLSRSAMDLSESRDLLYGDLPETKIRHLEALERDYLELTAAYQTRDGDVVLPEDAAKLKFLEEERKKDLAALLTPEELENYELRSSETARGLKSQLAAFDPTEDEYKAIFQAQRAFENKYGEKQLGVDESRELREAEMRKVLSPERFEDYKIRTSGSYPPVRELVTSMKLPQSTIADTIRLQQETMKRAMEIRSDPSLTSKEISAKLNAMADEASAKLTSTFGQEGFQNYSSRAGGWIKRLRTGTP